MSTKFIIAAAAAAAIGGGGYYYITVVQNPPWRDAVRQEMVDPASTMFQNERVSATRADVICGEYNSKNRMGGYVGWTRFQAHGPYLNQWFVWHGDNIPDEIKPLC